MSVSRLIPALDGLLHDSWLAIAGVLEGAPDTDLGRAYAEAVRRYLEPDDETVA